MKKVLLMLLVAVVTLSGCGKDDGPSLNINQKEVKLKYDGDFQFSIENASSVEWSSSDEFVGTIGSDGKFEASHIGETTITGKTEGGSVTAKVVVEPTIMGVTEPYIMFGKGKSDVKSYEKRTLGNETSTGLVYTETSTYTRGAIYLFENNLFTSVGLLWNNSKISDAATFYAERYQILTEIDDVYYFKDRDSKTLIGVTYNSSLGMVALYSKYTLGAKSSGLNIKGSKVAELDKYFMK